MSSGEYKPPETLKKSHHVSVSIGVDSCRVGKSCFKRSWQNERFNSYLTLNLHLKAQHLCWKRMFIVETL